MVWMGQSGEAIDSPYEMCLSGEQNGADSPYTVAELERLLRYHDSDATQLSNRILAAATVTDYSTNPFTTYSYLSSESPGIIAGPSDHRRRMLTTISSDIPVPATPLPPEFRTRIANQINEAKLPGASSILDLYYYKLAQNLGYNNPARIREEMIKIAPWRPERRHPRRRVIRLPTSTPTLRPILPRSCTRRLARCLTFSNRTKCPRAVPPTAMLPSFIGCLTS
jgi:hypothetical protein